MPLISDEYLDWALRLLGGNNLRDALLGDQLQQRTILGALLTQCPLAEQFSDLSERRPAAEIRLGHPLPVHRCVQRHREYGDHQWILRQSWLLARQRTCQLMHCSLGHAIANHAGSALQCRLGASQGQQATSLEVLCSQCGWDAGAPDALTPHEIRVLGQICEEGRREKEILAEE